MKEKSGVISAEVLLKSASGKSIKSPDVLITAENVHLFKPSPDVAKKAQMGFEKYGFKVKSSPTGLTLVGSVKLFEKVFKVSLSLRKFSESGQVGISLNMEPQVPASLENFVEAVIFPPPPEFFVVG